MLLKKQNIDDQENQYGQRPYSAMPFKSRNILGSSCPIIIKHEFPNETNLYIDNMDQEMSSTKRRNIYDRPNTAKIKSAFVKGNLSIKQRPTTSVNTYQNGSSQMNSADLYKKLIEGQKIAKEAKFVIKPARKLNTLSIHSALFKIKKQKEQLDLKIRKLDDFKSNFSESDFYLIANSGAIDYLFLKQKQQLLNSIPDNNNNLNKNKSATTLLQRPKSSIGTTTTTKKNANHQNIKKNNSRDQIVMLRNDSSLQNTSELNEVDLEILGNCAKIFQNKERQQVKQWGEPVDQQDIVRNNIEQMGQNYNNIQRLLSGKQKQSFVQEIKEEDEHEEQQQQQHLNIEEQILRYNNNNNILDSNRQLIEPKIFNNNYSTPHQQQNVRFFNNDTNSQQSKGIYPKLPKKKDFKRIHSANNNLFKSTSVATMFDKSLTTRPQTAHLRQGPQHALLTYGPVQVIKERITRNFDHLEILKEQENIEKQKQVKTQEKNLQKQEQQQIKVTGMKLQVANEQENMYNLQNKAQQAIQLQQNLYQQETSMNNYQSERNPMKNNSDQNLSQNRTPLDLNIMQKTQNNFKGNRPATAHKTYQQKETITYLQTNKNNELINYGSANQSVNESPNKLLNYSNQQQQQQQQWQVLEQQQFEFQYHQNNEDDNNDDEVKIQKKYKRPQTAIKRI